MTTSLPLASCAIRTIGVYLPEGIVPSSVIETNLGVEPGWIKQRTGIESRRRVSSGQAASDLGVHAARAAMAAGEVSPDEIDVILCATCSGDMIVPSTACWIHRALGWRPMPAFDVSATCAGFLYAMELVSGLLGQGRYRNALIVATEAMSPFLLSTDRQCSGLFGDGAAATVVGLHGWIRLLDSDLGADGGLAELITLQGGGSRTPTSAATVQNNDHYLRMNGREVYRQAVERMTSCVQRMLAKWSLGTSDVAWIIPHQANARIAEAVGQRLGVNDHRLVIDMQDLGNTSGATIPIALERTRPRMGAGDLVIVTTFGAGATWGCQLYQVS
ncbi:MAG: ketoacyl-ACP synthase III [Phycisphaerae bacterium]|jgi:3-oxoacyl-[acyl-carrier-protein] synthase-3|nr:ketoacyl-ACP synthase III [Phycisphaerae bacterium]